MTIQTVTIPYKPSKAPTPPRSPSSEMRSGSIDVITGGFKTKLLRDCRGSRLFEVWITVQSGPAMSIRCAPRHDGHSKRHLRKSDVRYAAPHTGSWGRLGGPGRSRHHPCTLPDTEVAASRAVRAANYPSSRSSPQQQPQRAPSAFAHGRVDPVHHDTRPDRAFSGC